MKLSKLSEESFAKLDASCRGVLTTLRDYCIENQCEAHITAQTSIEGLAEDEMKLFFQIVRDNEMIDYAIVKVYGSIQVIGWNIYLHDTLNSVKYHLNKGNAYLKMATEAKTMN